MLKFIARKSLIIIFSLLLANFTGFAFALYVAPMVMAGNPYSHGGSESFQILPIYLDYLQGILKGDFGSTFTGGSVLPVISRVGVVSLGLMSIALLLSVIGGIILGRLAVRRGKPGIASWLTVLSTVGLASPSFYIAVILIFLSLQLLLRGSSGEPLIPFIGFGWDSHLILPVCALALQPMVKIARMVGGLLSEEMEKPYVIASLGFGYKFSKIKRKFAFRSILSSVILIIAASTRVMIAELIIIERLFNWPGLGRLISETLNLGNPSADYLSPPMVAILLTTLAAFFLLIDLFATIISRLLDPRLQVEFESELTSKMAV